MFALADARYGSAGHHRHRPPAAPCSASAALGFWALLRAKHRVRSASALPSVAAAVWLIVPQEFKERFSYSG